jgi:hypothetical protein
VLFIGGELFKFLYALALLDKLDVCSHAYFCLQLSTKSCSMPPKKRPRVRTKVEQDESVCLTVENQGSMRVALSREQRRSKMAGCPKCMEGCRLLACLGGSRVVDSSVL